MQIWLVEQGIKLDDQIHMYTRLEEGRERDELNYLLIALRNVTSSSAAFESNPKTPVL